MAAARPSGVFRDALRAYAGMLSSGSWLNLPATLATVLRDGTALVLVLPPEHSWPSEGDRQAALRRGDRLSLPRLQLVPRADALNWELSSSHGLPSHIHWREPQHQAIQPVEPGTEAAVREQIASLLGDADAPDRIWAWPTSTSTTSAARATTRNSFPARPCLRMRPLRSWRSGPSPR